VTSLLTVLIIFSHYITSNFVKLFRLWIYYVFINTLTILVAIVRLLYRLKLVKTLKDLYVPIHISNDLRFYTRKRNYNLKIISINKLKSSIKTWGILIYVLGTYTAWIEFIADIDSLVYLVPMERITTGT